MAQGMLSVESSMPRRSGGLLQRALLTDALASGAAAILLLAAAEWLSPYLGLSVSFIRGVGLVLIPWTILLFIVANGPRRRPFAIGSIIAVNLLWVVASAGLLIAEVVSPTNLGTAVVIVQAVVVVGIASAQFLGWSRER